MTYEFNKFYYKPLPENLAVRESDIEGSGVFAKERIEAGLDLGMTHIKVPIIQVFWQRFVVKLIELVGHNFTSLIVLSELLLSFPFFELLFGLN